MKAIYRCFFFFFNLEGIRRAYPINCGVCSWYTAMKCRYSMGYGAMRTLGHVVNMWKSFYFTLCFDLLCERWASYEHVRIVLLFVLILVLNSVVFFSLGFFCLVFHSDFACYFTSIFFSVLLLVLILVLLKCFCNFFHLFFFSLRFCMLFNVNKFSFLFYIIFYIKIFSFRLRWNKNN